MREIEEQLKQYWKGGNPDLTLDEILKKIWQAYYPRLSLFVVQRVKIGAECEDIVQEILLKCFESIGRYNLEYAFSTWLYTLANHYCTDVFRKFRFRKTLAFSSFRSEEPIDPPDCQRPGPETEFGTNEKKKEIAYAIAQLTPIDRQLVVLRYFEDIKLFDIGKIMGIPVGTVKYRMHEIKKVLRSVLGESYDRE